MNSRTWKGRLGSARRYVQGEREEVAAGGAAVGSARTCRRAGPGPSACPSPSRRASLTAAWRSRSAGGRTASARRRSAAAAPVGRRRRSRPGRAGPPAGTCGSPRLSSNSCSIRDDPLLPAALALALGQPLGRRPAAAGRRPHRWRPWGRPRCASRRRVLERLHLRLDLGDVLLLAHADRALAAPVQELADDRLLARSAAARAGRTSPGCGGTAARGCPGPCGRVPMSWVTIRNVASICALRSTISWFR